MALNEKLIQLKDNINSLKQELTNAVVSKGGNVSETNTFSEIISSVKTISGGGGKMKWFDGLRFTSSVNDSQVENILTGCDFSEVTDLSDLLCDRNNITTFPSFDTSKANNLSNLFKNCTSLISLPYFDVSNASNVDGMIEGCTNLQDVGGFGGLKENFNFMMNSKLSHDSLMNIINNLATVSGKKLSIGQNNRDKLSDEEIAIATSKGWNVVAKLPYVSGLFKNDSTTTDEILESIFQAYDTANVTDFGTYYAGGFFQNCSSITKIPLIDTSNAVSMDKFFYGCSLLTSIPLLKTSKVKSTSYMFQNCSSLTSIPLIDLSKSERMESMFEGCSSLITIPEFNVSNTTSSYYMFKYCSNLEQIPSLNTSKVESVDSMFFNCGKLKKVSSLDCYTVDNMVYMTMNCSSLRYMLLKNLGTQPSINYFMGNISNTKWGVEDSSIPESAGAKQSMIDSMITYSFDRASAGYSPLTYELSSASKAVLTEEEIAAVTSKGYTIA